MLEFFFFLKFLSQWIVFIILHSFLFCFVFLFMNIHLHLSCKSIFSCLVIISYVLLFKSGALKCWLDTLSAWLGLDYDLPCRVNWLGKVRYQSSFIYVLLEWSDFSEKILPILSLERERHWLLTQKDTWGLSFKCVLIHFFPQNCYYKNFKHTEELKE